jgi:extradiol dioxygenase family protein
VIDVDRVDFIAVPVEDLGRADAFYGETLGLARNPNSSGERWVEYETGNLTIGLSTFGGGVAFGVEDVAAARETLEGAGVEFGTETFDTGVCHVAGFKDPAGNPHMLHHRYAPLERWEPPTGEFERTDFISIPVPDRPTGAAFYSDTLGLKRNGLSSDEWPEFEAGNATIVVAGQREEDVLLNTPEQTGDAFKAGNYSISLRVADVGATMERLQGAGVQFEHPQVYDSSVCHMAFLKDPDGNALILHHRYAPYSDGSMP